MNHMSFAGIVAAVLAFAAPAFAEEVSIETVRGAVSLPVNPAPLVVLDVAAIDTISAMEVPIAGVPDNLYVDYLGDVAAQAEKMGTLFEPNLEALAMLSPALIVAGGRSATQVEALGAVAPTIDMTIFDDLTGQALARIDAYGKLFGKTEKAAEMHATLASKLDEARAAVAGKGAALILQTNGPKISAFGKGSRFGWIHTALGLPEARENLNPETHGDAISFEFIAETDPEWLIVVDRAAAVGDSLEAAAATLDNPLVKATRAGRNGHIIYLNPTPVYIAGGGYRSMIGTLDEVITAFSK